MTDDLPPKLREFEAKLRQLKPLEPSFVPFVEPLRPSWLDFTTKSTKVSQRAQRRIIAVLATAATILAIVWLIPQQQPTEQVIHITSQPIPETAELLPSAISPLPSSNMRQQLAELLDEMNVAELQTVAKREYPVVEIVVQTNPPQIVMPMGERMRWRWEEEMLIF